MDKKTIYAIMLILMVNLVFALSDPINQTLTEYTNLTRADNILEIAVEMNNWLSGLFGISILLMVFVITFSLTLFFSRDFGSAILLASFLETFSSILLFVSGLVSDVAIYFSVPLFLFSLGFVMVRR